MQFVGGFKYRFLKADGSHVDAFQAGATRDGADTVWRLDNDTLQTGSIIFTNVVNVEEIERPPRAINEMR
ncbi:hypothetical protein D3C81_45740 [compost metagenome]